MKKILQELGTGNTLLCECPTPSVQPDSVLISTENSLVSIGTERMLLEFGKSSMISKAKKNPQKVKQVIQKAKLDGIFQTIDAVKSKLSEPIQLGYSNVGRIIAVGSNVSEFSVGDRVVSNGPHAEVVRVSKNLCAKIPANVSNEEAAFTVIGSIGLNGVRISNPTLGETFVVIGTGLIGLLIIQLLKAHGCEVIALDPDKERLKLATKFGAQSVHLTKDLDVVDAVKSLNKNIEVDGVLVATATASNKPISDAAKMCRKQGRVVLVGIAGLDLSRDDFYHKELNFKVSCSYGPGRYDASYEEKGNDYPYGYVRWTEKRNFEAVLKLLSNKQLSIDPLLTKRADFNNVIAVYKTLSDNKEDLGILLDYEISGHRKIEPLVKLKQANNVTVKKPVIGLIGAGNYASRILIPAFKKADAQLHTIVSSEGTSAVIHGIRHNFNFASTDIEEVLNNEEINTVVIATRHNTHAQLVSNALQAGKHVFVEKPLAIDLEGIALIKETFDNLNSEAYVPQLMVGYNRRFAPHIIEVKSLLANIRKPKSIIMTMNAGHLPGDHWTQDPLVGGGRIIGEACHYIDLMRHLVGHEITSSSAAPLRDGPNGELLSDNASITLRFADGSFGTILYLSNGSNQFPKERIEVFCGGNTIQLDNFRTLRLFGFKGHNALKLWKQDKGQKACAHAFLDSIQTGNILIPTHELLEVANETISIASSLRAT